MAIMLNLHDTRTSATSTPLEPNKNSPKCLKYNLTHSINATPAIVVENIQTNSLRGFTTYAKQFLIEKYTDTCTIQNCYSCNQYHI